MIKESTKKRAVLLVNVYAPKNIKQTLMELKGEKDKSTVTFRDLNTPSQ